jgi:hypothetical protein
LPCAKPLPGGVVGLSVCSATHSISLPPSFPCVSEANILTKCQFIVYVNHIVSPHTKAILSVRSAYLVMRMPVVR